VADASMMVLPGSPEVAETIEVIVRGNDAKGWELYIDDILIEAATKSDHLTLSISAIGNEVALANFGTCSIKRSNRFKIGESIRMIEPLHHVELRLIAAQSVLAGR